jgi:endonuclease/exonuclease/phosphatase family metal-dependent hydrolase
MEVTVGTFNLNNLFSRYNFRGEIEAIKYGDSEINSLIEYNFSDPEKYKIRKYMGRLVKGKPEDEREKIAERIKTMDVDVLAVQEVEDIDTLKRFEQDYLGGIYPYEVLVEGNDPRLIDVGVLSKLPVRGITSWQNEIHPEDPNNKVFGRDLLEVEIYNETRSKKLFTMYNNHLKSHYVSYDQDQEEGKKAADARRLRQAETIVRIVDDQMRPGSAYIVLGDMNDPPTSKPLLPLVKAKPTKLVNALKDPIETRPAKEDDPPPDSTAWTHRYKPSGKPAQYELFDQIWLSPSLAEKQTGAWIDRRKRHGGDGSDHDPAWVALDL